MKLISLLIVITLLIACKRNEKITPPLAVEKKLPQEYLMTIKNAEELIDTLVPQIVICDDVKQSKAQREKKIVRILNSVKPNPLVNYICVNISYPNTEMLIVKDNNKHYPSAHIQYVYGRGNYERDYVEQIGDSIVSKQRYRMFTHDFKNRLIVKDNIEYNYATFVTHNPIYYGKKAIVVKVEQFLSDSTGLILLNYID